MKTTQILIIVIAVIVIAVIALYAAGSIIQTTSNTTSTSSTWISGPSYPIEIDGTYGVGGQSCAVSSNIVYCAGGSDIEGNPYSNVYSAALGSSVPGNWSASTSYPGNIAAQSCVVYSSYLYCVGGIIDNSEDDTAASYFTSISSSGTLGTWNATTSYPIPIDTEYCAASSGYIYCVGGNNETDGTNGASVPTSSVWYAPINASGIGSWSITLSYPQNVYFPSCVASATDIYCVGGENNNQNELNSVYYAPISSSGVGAWTQTTNYPASLNGQSCGVSSGYIYCVGGVSGSSSLSSAVYYASISSTGVGTWQKAANYPLSTATTCVVTSTDLYCFGGFTTSSNGETADSYYATLSSISG